MFDKIISLENLFAAWEEFLRGKRGRRDVVVFSMQVEDHLFYLHRRLADGTWRHGGYAEFRACDPKPRMIHKASVADRVLHHALVRVLEPVFDRSFIHDSWSCRKGKGTHHAVVRCHSELQRLARTYRGELWILKCDIKKYFQSIDHEILSSILSQTITDERTRVLVHAIIESFNPGVPLGNLTSQLFANVYLNAFDHVVKERLHAPFFIRYSDDFLLAHPCREWLEAALPFIRDTLYATRRLTVHPQKILLRPFHHGIDWLGAMLYPEYRVMRTRTKRRLWRMTKVRVNEYLAGERSIESLTSTFASYDGMLKTVWNGTDRIHLEALRNCL